MHVSMHMIYERSAYLCFEPRLYTARRTARRERQHGGAMQLTYPGHYSSVEAWQLGVVIRDLFFDNPGEQANRHGQANQPVDGHGVGSAAQRGSNLQCRPTLRDIRALKVTFSTFLSTSFAPLVA